MIKKLKENYLLIAIVILATALRVYHIDFQSIWLDEIHTMNEANPKIPLKELYNVIMAGEQMPPLYFYSLYFLFKIFGYTTLVARVYSAIVGIVSVFSIYLLGKEMINKKAGLFAALLLSVNSFHLYYSQDARPYILFFLFTTFSFYNLIKFLKLPSKKNALYYGITTAMMINTHFFGLFVLFSQYITLLFFLILSKNTQRKGFFVNSFISGIVTLLLFIPSMKVFIKVSEIKDFWIPAPTLDAYTLIFKEFFGNSELVLTLVGLLFIIYFIKLSKEKNTSIEYKSIIENKTIFAFVLLIPWIIIVLLIPLIRSYLSIPMIISRYFISILPALIIILSIAINQFKNKIIQIGIIGLFIVFSLTDIIIVKKYYTNINKAQFRESTQFIIDNNSKKEPVVSSLGWYLPYFLNKAKNKNTIVDKSLDEYIAEISKNSSNIKSFWYFDGHIRPFNPSEESKLFLENNFVVDKNIDLYDCYAKHFILKSDFKPKIDISSFNPLKDRNGDNINFSVEVFDNSQEKISISGWAYFDKQVASNSKIQLLAIKDNQIEMIFNESVRREDVTSYFKSPYDISNSGFKAVFSKLKYGKGTYKIAIYIVDNQSHKKGLVITDKFFKVE